MKLKVPLTRCTTERWRWRIRSYSNSIGINVDFELTLWHSHCCGSFVRNNVKYRMLPMGHIGARVETWRQIIDMTGHGNSSLTWQSIVDYLEEELGPTVREQVVFASKNWYHDQRLISIRIDQWMRRYPDHKVGSSHYSRFRLKRACSS